MAKNLLGRNLLQGARAYLSGPMDWVASRANEKKYGWRVRVSEFLAHHGVTVFDPWHKPAVRGMHGYGEEGGIETGIETGTHLVIAGNRNGDAPSYRGDSKRGRT